MDDKTKNKKTKQEKQTCTLLHISVHFKQQIIAVLKCGFARKSRAKTK